MKPLIAQRLRELRARHSLTQQQVGAACGRDASTIGDWEKGSSAPPADIVAVLAQTFRVSPSYLIGVSDFESGIAPGSYLVDLDAYERNDPIWWAKVPPRHRIVDGETHQRMLAEAANGGRGQQSRT